MSSKYFIFVPDTVPGGGHHYEVPRAVSIYLKQLEHKVKGVVPASRPRAPTRPGD